MCFRSQPTGWYLSHEEEQVIITMRENKRIERLKKDAADKEAAAARKAQIDDLTNKNKIGSSRHRRTVTHHTRNIHETIQTIMEWMRKTKTKKKPPLPRLQRSNTKKNINYQLPTTVTTTTVPSRTPPSDEETNLRVLGIDDEFDRIFQSLGISRPEDFSIPTHDWEARKIRFVNLDDAPSVVIVRDSPSSSGEVDVRDVVDPVRNG